MELRRLEAPFEPGVRSAIEAFDCGNSRVNGFLRDYAEPIVDQSLGTVLVLIEHGEIVSFVSLSFASMTLTNSEKGVFRSVTTAFGAVRSAASGRQPLIRENRAGQSCSRRPSAVRAASRRSWGCAT